MPPVTLRCECGGPLELTSGSYDRDEDGQITGEGRAIETYECVECGRNGSYGFGDHGPDVTRGCVTATTEVYRGP